MKNKIKDKDGKDKKFEFKGMLVPRMNENNVEVKMLKEDRFYQP